MTTCYARLFYTLWSSKKPLHLYFQHIAELIFFAFSENLSAENSKLSADSGIQRIKLLECMFICFEYFKTCFAQLNISLQGLTCIQSIVYFFVCAYVSDTFLSQSFSQLSSLFWSETFCLFALWRCPHNYVLLLQRYNLQN